MTSTDLHRRILLVLTMAALMLVSAAIGVGLADWPFLARSWRVAQLADSGEWPDSFYQPVVRIGGAAARPLAPGDPAAHAIAPAALDAAASWAEANNSVALLVAQGERLVLERYWQGMTASDLFSARAMSRSLLGMLAGFAVRDGRLDLDQRVDRFLTEWQGDPRGAITLRQLLQNVSGLEEVPLNAVTGGWRAALQNYVGRNARLSLGNDFARTAMSFPAAHEAGFRFALSNANAQLAGVVLERALGDDYEKLAESLLWKPLEAGPAEFYMDRANGMPAVYCCMRATARGFLRLGILLANDGVIGDRRILPAGWVAEMARTSQANPLYGLQVWAGRAKTGLREYVPGGGQGVRHSEDFAADAIWMEGGGGRTIWAIPSRQLVIVRLGRASTDWDGSKLVNLIVGGLPADNQTGTVAGL